MTQRRLRHDRLKALRQEIGLSQDEVAKRIGGTAKQYSNWETGKVDPSVHFLYELTRFYNVTVDYLLGRSEDRHGYPAPKELSPLQRQILDAMERDDISAVSALLARFIAEQQGKQSGVSRKKPPISH